MITSAIFCGFHLFFSSFLVCLFPVILGAFTLSWALLPFFVRVFSSICVSRLFHAPSSCRCSQYTLSSASQFLECIMRGEEAVGGAVIEDAQVYASHSCTYKQVLSVHVTKNGSYLSG